MKIFERPMTVEEHMENLEDIRKAPNRFHLIDVLKHIRYGRPEEDQKAISRWIKECEDNDIGTPFN